MEGLLLVPPDRTALIGRPVWKPRYLVFGLAGSAQLLRVESATSLQRQSQTARKGSASVLKPFSNKASLGNINDAAVDKNRLVLSIYKQKGDQEPIQQHSLSRLKSVDVQTLQHPKKTGHATPTLIIHLELDVAAEKLRKRRSSRTGGFTSSNPSNVLHFRSVDNERYSIHDWQMAILPLVQTSFGEEKHEEGVENDGPRPRRQTNSSLPISPLSPIFSHFATVNPFSNQRPTTSSANRPGMPQPRGSDHTFSSIQSSRDRQTQMASPEPSLRSKRSDLSSQASSQQRPFGSTYYSSTLQSTSSDLPSPNTAYDTTDQEVLFVEGWTLTQGRRCGSVHSSHTRNSISTNPPAITTNTCTNLASSPVSRETILDRAFQMRYIPGSENFSTSTADEKELSSIARFEALMSKADEEKAREEELNKAQNHKSSWDLDEESEEDSDVEGARKRDEKIIDDDNIDPMMIPPEPKIPTPAQRALDYISGRTKSNSHEHSHSSISPLSPPPPSQYYRDRSYLTSTRARTYTEPIINNASTSDGVKFQDSFETLSGRPTMGQHNAKQGKQGSHRRTKSSRPTSLALPSRTLIKGSVDLESSFNRRGSIDRERENTRNGMERSHTTGHLNRLSTSSTVGTTPQGQLSNDKKRLSFTEFTRRLSSTSSLLLVQTNTNLSSSSGRLSSESSGWFESSSITGNDDFRSGGLRHSAIGIPRDNAFGYGRDGGRESRDGGSGGLSRDEKRCGWRGSVGVFGSEGGFL